MIKFLFSKNYYLKINIFIMIFIMIFIIIIAYVAVLLLDWAGEGAELRSVCTEAGTLDADSSSFHSFLFLFISLVFIISLSLLIYLSTYLNISLFFSPSLLSFLFLSKITVFIFHIWLSHHFVRFTPLKLHLQTSFPSLTFSLLCPLTSISLSLRIISGMPVI